MARFLIQNAASFEFLHWSPRSLDVDWTPSLIQAMRYGIVRDLDQAVELMRDHAEPGSALLVDLDKEYPDV